MGLTNNDSVGLISEARVFKCREKERETNEFVLQLKQLIYNILREQNSIQRFPHTLKTYLST